MRYATLSLAAIAAATTVAATASTAQAQGRRSVTGAVGFGVATLPRYVGSGDYRVLPMPVVQLEYKDRVFLGGSRSGVGGGLGAYLLRTPALTWHVDISGAEARPEGRGNALAGMGKRSAVSYAGTGVAYRFASLTASALVSTGLGNEAGTFGSLGLSTQRSLARRWVGELSTGATFADADNMAFDFGVTGTQSTRRRALAAAGDGRLHGISSSAYAPGSGLKSVSGSASLSYLLTERSRLMTFAQGTRLSQEASRSPLVRERQSAAAGMAIVYGF